MKNVGEQEVQGKYVLTFFECRDVLKLLQKI